ncbi:MAG: GNAT family N-acetyltransferase [Syntrophobacteraceae bacterium]|jgi:ribosomal protein S18 acetylase RimI-like enzyme|nr:GNAT family N-acetyltransferase [Syntrophobacteraceae bacterium]
MTDPFEPFPKDCIHLPTFSLCPIARGEAGEIADVIASMDPWRTLGYGSSSLSSYLLRFDPALSRYAVRTSGETSGVVCVRHPWLLGPYIELLALFQRAQGKGLGRDVISWIQTRGTLSSSRNLWATVSSFNTRAWSFYARLGFARVASLKDLVQAGTDEILIRKTLD